MDIATGDEVIAPSHTAVPTVAAIGMTGATPVLVDIEEHYFTIDAEAVEAAITPRTRAIVAVHLYGQPADLHALSEIASRHDLTLIEDCAQSTGACWGESVTGGIGHIGCFSFFPTKNLGAMGDGGCVVTNDPAITKRLQALRQYGWDAGRISEFQGYNSRLDELQAAILRVKLPYLNEDNGKRRVLANNYDRAFADLPIELPKRRHKGTHVFHLYVIQSEQRDALNAHLKKHGIGAGIHYYPACHQMPAYAQYAPRRDGLPMTERVAKQVLSLPLFPEMTEATQTQVINAVKGFF